MEHISVTDPIGPAIARVRQLLFRPFDLGKWFTIGFCAWLAGLGERAARGNFNYNTNDSNHHAGDFHQQVEHAREWIVDNFAWLLPLVIFFLAVGLALAVLFLWLNSRGKFMLLHCVALDRAEVRDPWNRYASAANSLFWFRLVFGLISIAISLPCIVFFMVILIISMAGHGINFVTILTLLGVVAVMMAIGLVFALIRKFTADFVVPIMYLRGESCLAAWREFLQMLGANIGHFALYILFQIVIAIAIATIIIIAVIGTCCILGCVMMIPYIGTVLLLPLIIFKRAYSLYYFAQFGPQFDVFRPVAAA